MYSKVLAIFFFFSFLPLTSYSTGLCNCMCFKWVSHSLILQTEAQNVPDKFWKQQLPGVEEITPKYSMLTFNLWWFMTCVYYFCLSLVFLSWLFDSRNSAVVVSDKRNFCISFSLPSLVIYLPLALFWWLMLSSLEVNGNRRHNHMYKDTEHNSFSERVTGFILLFHHNLITESVTVFSLTIWILR